MTLQRTTMLSLVKFCLLASGVLNLNPLSIQAQGREKVAEEGRGSTVYIRAMEAETARRKNLVAASEKAIREGEQLYQAEEYQSAAERFRFVLENLPVNNETQSLYDRAVNGLLHTDIRLAETSLAEKKYESARNASLEGLRYDPQNKRLKETFKAAEKGLGVYSDIPPQDQNSATTPEFIQAINQVKDLLFEAEGAKETGQYDKAEDRYKQVLVIDPYNEAAREGIKQVAELKRRYARDAYANTRKQMLYEVTKAWSNPVKRNVLKGQEQQSEAPANLSNIARLEEKLNSIVIDRIQFQEASIEDAIEFLRAKARDADPDKKGINFVLKTTMAVSEDGEAETDTGAAEEKKITIQKIDSRTITLDVTDLPLAAVLDLIARQADLIYKVEEQAILIAPATETIDTLFTREFRVPPGFFSTQIEIKEGVDLGAQVQMVRGEVRKKLEDLGAQFPPGATANYLPAGSKLVVRNTLANLAIIENAIAQENVVTPQVKIETRFMEVNQSDLDELSFRWKLNRRRRGQSQATDTPGLRTSAPTGERFGLSGLPEDLAVAGGAISPNNLDALLTAGSLLGPIGQAVQTAITLGKYRFQMLVYALSQKTGNDLLAVPSVTTKSGQQAQIQIIRQFFYPDPNNLNPPEIDANISILPSGATYRLVTPSTPSDFRDEPVGVTLNVTPQVGPDNQTIALELLPKIVDFEGFINYGSPIRAVDIEGNSSVIQAENVINTPVFNTRSIDTRLTVSDGQTVLLGGLLREDVQKVRDKIPILGDIPLLGRLFRSNIDQKIKKNLLIFVTCSLVKPDGELYNNRNFEDEGDFDNTPMFETVRREEPAAPLEEGYPVTEKNVDSKGGLVK